VLTRKKCYKHFHLFNVFHNISYIIHHSGLFATNIFKGIFWHKTLTYSQGNNISFAISRCAHYPTLITWPQVHVNLVCSSSLFVSESVSHELRVIMIWLKILKRQLSQNICLLHDNKHYHTFVCRLRTINIRKRVILNSTFKSMVTLN